MPDPTQPDPTQPDPIPADPIPADPMPAEIWSDDPAGRGAAPGASGLAASLPGDALPIDAVLPDLRRALADQGRAVLVAPPGAGKTTRVPLALMEQVRGRILMLEPRRLAARAAAERLAQSLGEAVGARVGYRMRGESVPGRRIEVVTEGILTRMIQTDPALDGVGCVIFDEFHERSLNADLGLALVWEARGALRDDLAVLVMSATLEAGPVAALLDGAPVIVSEGRAFPVQTRWLDRPLPPGGRLAEEAARLIARAHAETRGTGGDRPEAADAGAPDAGADGAGEGGPGRGGPGVAGDDAGDVDVTGGTILAFLPGEREIRRVTALLAGTGCEVLPLYGALPAAAQRAALAPPGPVRRIVLATAIAETSLTIPGVRVVVDAGRARRARFDPGSGMSRLVTERVSRAEAEQRRGRAGRVAPGICYRMWARAEEGALPAFAPPEIAVADLTGLALELAAWGAGAGALAFLTPPPEAALAEARGLLADLGALDGSGRITPHGQALARLPLHPRLAHMLSVAGPHAADLAALLSDRDPLRAAGSDLEARLRAIRARGGAPEADRQGLDRIRAEARRLARLVASRDGGGDAVPPAPPLTARPPASDLTAGAMVSLAYPDRIGLRRPGTDPRFVLSGGKGAILPGEDPLAGSRWIVAADLDGDQREARIRLAARLDEADLRALHGARIRLDPVCAWSRREGRVVARLHERLGALILSDRPWPDAPPEARAHAALEGLRQDGLPWTPAAARLRARIALLPDAAPVSDAALLGEGDWLLPWLGRARSLADLRALDLVEPLKARLGWEGQQRLDREVPPAFTTPLGRRVPIDYGGPEPSIELRLQELFGVTRHPSVGGRPLRVTLLSPGGRPVQVTMDLPGFWASSYAEVRKDMRGRYPRHPWPEDPTQADPTTRAKPRGT